MRWRVQFELDREQFESGGMKSARQRLLYTSRRGRRSRWWRGRTSAQCLQTPPGTTAVAYQTEFPIHHGRPVQAEEWRPKWPFNLLGRRLG